MAAHPDLIHLRRHTLPAHFVAAADCPAEASAAFGHLPGASGRPRLLASWHLDTDARPICGWSLDTGDPD